MKGIKELVRIYFINYLVCLVVFVEKYNIMGMFEDLKDLCFLVVVGLILYKVGGYINYERDFKGVICYYESDDYIRIVY